MEEEEFSEERFDEEGDEFDQTLEELELDED